MSKTPAYTPSPWSAQNSLPGTVLIVAQGGLIAAVDGSEAAEANAALIVEAPTLAALVREMADEHTDVSPQWWPDARACLLRIEGGV